MSKDDAFNKAWKKTCSKCSERTLFFKEHICMNRYEIRLLQEWEQHGKIVIAVDYDDTISPWGFSAPEDLIQLDKTINILKVAKETGAYITIWSACNPDRYDEIKKYCASKGLEIDSINTNPIDLPYGKDRKIYANIYIDDRAGLLESLAMLEKVMYIIRGKKASELLKDGNVA